MLSDQRTYSKPTNSLTITRTGSTSKTIGDFGQYPARLWHLRGHFAVDFRSWPLPCTIACARVGRVVENVTLDSFRSFISSGKKWRTTLRRASFDIFYGGKMKLRAAKNWEQKSKKKCLLEKVKQRTMTSPNLPYKSIDGAYGRFLEDLCDLRDKMKRFRLSFVWTSGS